MMAEQFGREEHSSILACLKCAKCMNSLRNPVQLSACLHIVCLDCTENLQSATNVNLLLCPKCGVQSAKPSVLRSISGVEESNKKNNDCDFCQSKQPALWFCFMCAKNICKQCRAQHDSDFLGHNPSLLSNPTNLGRSIFENNGIQQEVLYSTPSVSSPSQDLEGTDGGSVSVHQDCPKCGDVSCSHVELLRFLGSNSDPNIGRCMRQGHVDSSGRQLEVKFFCKVCWKPICGDCSKGEHKLHDTEDLFNAQEFLRNSVSKILSKLNMLVQRFDLDISEEKDIEESLRAHVQLTEREIIKRKIRILEDASEAFNKTVTDVELQGKDILQSYRSQLNEAVNCQKLINRYYELLNALTVDNDLNINQYNYVFQCITQVTRFIHEMDQELTNVKKPAERCLVLPEIKGLPTIPLPLARVGTEWKQLKLAFKLLLPNEVGWVHSIIVKGSEECLLSCKLEGKDAIIGFEKKSDTKKRYSVPRGTYLIALTRNQEIVASYSSRSHFSLKYSDGSVISRGDAESDITFETIRVFDYPPKGIATTKDNNILVCCQSSDKKDVNYLMMLSLQGKIIKDSCNEAGHNMMSPNYVAISDSDDICVSDTEGNSVVILDSNLDITERVKYTLPSSLCNAKFKATLTGQEEYELAFRPHGLCYDSYGRIIVADPDNDSVVRLIRDPDTHKYKMEPLLTRSDCKTSDYHGLQQPKLVAMGPESRLWVVCRQQVLVYDYCT
ncbi:unnamed protein product [Lymnaea stagnalis]|uniref:Uncharacterized protein n=1 Tax=Lymnaea stagnalis TaxID=6523 RepID=A0AAV2HSM8_LYMST